MFASWGRHRKYPSSIQEKKKSNNWIETQKELFNMWQPQCTDYKRTPQCYITSQAIIETPSSFSFSVQQQWHTQLGKEQRSTTDSLRVNLLKISLCNVALSTKQKQEKPNVRSQNKRRVWVIVQSYIHIHSSIHNVSLSYCIRKRLHVFFFILSGYSEGSIVGCVEK